MDQNQPAFAGVQPEVAASGGGEFTGNPAIDEILRVRESIAAEIRAASQRLRASNERIEQQLAELETRLGETEGNPDPRDRATEEQTIQQPKPPEQFSVRVPKLREYRQPPKVDRSQPSSNRDQTER